MHNNELDVRDSRPRIDVSDYFDLRSWAKRFGATAGEVRRAVTRVGDHPGDVETYLKYALPEGAARSGQDA